MRFAGLVHCRNIVVAQPPRKRRDESDGPGTAAGLRVSALRQRLGWGGKLLPTPTPPHRGVGVVKERPRFGVGFFLERSA